MPIPSESFQALNDAVNRLGAESILAQVGRDDGLIPAYSLLGEIRDLVASCAELSAPISSMHGRLDQKLETMQPFDEACLGQLRQLVDWLPSAIAAVSTDKPVPAFDHPATIPRPSGPARNEAVVSDTKVDILLELDLAENHELLREFFSEVVDHLQQIEGALLALEHQPDNLEALNSIFRSFHTIKGNAGFLQLVPMHKLAHEVESLLDLARSQKLVLTSAIISEILRSRDTLQAQVQQIEVALETGRLPSEIIPVSHLIVAVKLLASGPSTENSPPSVSVPVAPSAPEVAPVINPDPLPFPTAVAENGKANGHSHSANTNTPKSGGSTVRVSTDKLDSLMDVVGELVIVHSQLIETSRETDQKNPTLQRNVAQLSRITKELQHTAMALRMIPITQIFQKMERLVRDLARDFGKKVHFTTSGEDTELDRTVVEEIADPLVHMVRNSMDHGIELPTERLASGKSETGTIHLHAYHQGSSIVIELQDDGRGIDPDKIFKKAVEKGLVAANAVLTREETLALIFAPGFSTAEKVTAVSGRGVGMDVVKRNIEKLRGKVEISSTVQQGSNFKIKLPLTMAIIDGLVVRVGEDRFILPSTSVQMALRPTRENIVTVHGAGEVLELRGRIMPLHRLHRRFGIPCQSENPWDGIVVILEANGKVCALLVDEMVSKQEVVIKSLGAYMQGLPGVSGGAILGDGNIALILDPSSLLQVA